MKEQQIVVVKGKSFRLLVTIHILKNGALRIDWITATKNDGTIYADAPANLLPLTLVMQAERMVKTQITLAWIAEVLPLVDMADEELQH